MGTEAINHEWTRINTNIKSLFLLYNHFVKFESISVNSWLKKFVRSGAGIKSENKRQCKAQGD